MERLGKSHIPAVWFSGSLTSALSLSLLIMANTWNVLFCIHHHFSYFFWKHFPFPFEISFQTTNCIFLKNIFLNIKKNIDISGVLHMKYCTTNSINNSEFLKVIILLHVQIIIKGDNTVFLVTIISKGGNIFNVFLIT